MTEQTQESLDEIFGAGVQEVSPEEKQAQEFEQLKAKADQLGVTYSGNIGFATLQERVKNKLIELENATMNADAIVGEQPAQAEKPEVTATEAPKDAAPAPVRRAPMTQQEARAELRRNMLKDAMRLRRVQITNLDPKKNNLPGEFITVANGVIGTVKKYIPFDEASDIGYHVPEIILKELRRRKFLQIREGRGRRGSTDVKISERWVPEYGIVELEPLTREEIRKLAVAQRAAAGLDD